MNSPGNLFRERVLVPVQALLRQGLHPRGLALALAWGVAIGLIPLPAVATLMAVAFAAVLRLNQAAIQLGNYAVGLLQLALFLPFIRMGEWLFDVPPIPLSASQLRERLQADAWGVVTELGDSVFHAVVAWGLVVPVVVAATYMVALPLCRRALPGADHAA